MYIRYFGLEEKPFAISPDPRYLYMSESHREALAHLLYGINSDGCLVLLTGDVGIGKTTVCRCLLEQLPESTDIALVFNPKLDAEELVKTICEELLALPEKEEPTNKDYIDRLNRHLLEAHAKGRTTVLIIDEAQNLEPDVLEQLRLLTNLETNTHKLLRIILIGQPELRNLLERDELTQVNQRITSRYHITALQHEDIRNYILHRLAVAGNESGRLFSEKAVQFIASKTKGVPRLINLLCDRALLGAYAENSDHVDLKVVKKAGQEVFPETSQHVPPASRRISPFAYASLLAIVISAVLYYTGVVKPPDQDVPAAVANQHAAANTPATAIEQAPQEHPAPKPSRIRVSEPVRLSTLTDFLFSEDQSMAAGVNGD